MQDNNINRRHLSANGMVAPTFPVGATSPKRHEKAKRQYKDEKPSPSCREPQKYYYVEDEGKRIPILLGRMIGQGGESVVRDLISPENGWRSRKYVGTHVVKIYNKPASKDYIAKLNSLIYTWQMSGKTLSGFCFPRNLVYDQKSDGHCVGFLMPRYNAFSLDQILGCFMDQRLSCRWKRPQKLRYIDLEWTPAELATLALNILHKLSELHQWGIYMCDFNPKNILVSENQEAWFIDVDSYQVGPYACPVYRPELSSPRLVEMGCPVGELLTEDDVNFSIAVLLFQIFFVGQHPYVRSEGEKTFEQHIKSRNFAYPLTYDTASYIPKGRWQNIWYSLPYDMKKCFYEAFTSDKYPSVEKWISVISRYKENIDANRIRRPITNMSGTQLQQSQIFLGYENDDNGDFEFDSATNPGLRQFDTTVINMETPENEYDIVLEFGSNSIHSYAFYNGEWRPWHFRTMHFNLIGKDGTMNINNLRYTLEKTGIVSSINNLRPAVTRVHAFGGICLRMLSNRQEVIDVLHETTNFHFGVLTSREEASIIAQAVIGNDDTLCHQPTLVADIGGFATDLITRYPDGTVTRHTYTRFGYSTLTNWLFSTNLRSANPRMVFETHDNCVENYRWNTGLRGCDNLGMVCIGALSGILEKGEKQRWLTIGELEQKKAELTEKLIFNRQQLTDLYVDVINSRKRENRKMDKNTVLRLTLPIYINLMKELNVKKVLVRRFGLGKAYANRYLTTKDMTTSVNTSLTNKQ